MHTAIALRKVGAGRALSLCWHAGHSSRPPPHGREQAWLRRGKTPTLGAPT